MALTFSYSVGYRAKNHAQRNFKCNEDARIFMNVLTQKISGRWVSEKTFGVVGDKQSGFFKTAEEALNEANKEQNND